ncbi:unnamed protein product [Auanema sp. JU1783]|nr:unnamed protein product [Auanema sp. JU1783]
MSVVDQLVDMGFDKSKAEKAFEVTKSSLEEAMEWLLAHDGEDLSSIPAPASDAPAAANSAPGIPTGAEEPITEQTPGSYKCNDCNKLFRDENAMMFHAAKSKHENFSESTEEIKPLTEEERKQKATELRQRIREAQAAKAEVERQEAIDREKKRIEEGKKMAEMREKRKEIDTREIVEARRKEKEETERARQRVIEQIRLDKEERAARASGIRPAEPVATVNPNPPPKVDYNQATIQVRLKDGKCVRNTFGAAEPLSAVRLWVQLNHSAGAEVNFMTPFPRKTFSSEDYNAPLKNLGLTPSASLVVI